MSKRLFALLLVLLAPELARTQVGPTHGTVIVLNLSEDELIIAADSKGNHASATTFSKPDYSQCKITTFDNQIVFAPVNYVGYGSTGPLDPVASWDARNILQRIVSETITSNGTVPIQSIASRWAGAMIDVFRNQYRWHPQEVIAEAVGGKIQMMIIIVTFNSSSPDPIGALIGDGIGNCWTCGQQDGGKSCAAGQIAIVAEFCSKSTDRGKEAQGVLTYDNSLMALGWDIRSLLALRLADLTEAYDLSGTVGGPIDVLQLKKDGGIRWLARKNNCPEDQK
jgi:hypothetical protein